MKSVPLVTESFIIGNNFSLMTPVAKDNFGWSNGDTILYLSILMASGGIIAILWDEFCESQAIAFK